MSGDPAIAAWERSAAKTSPLDALAAAREALAPLRELHRPIAMCGVTVCIHCRAATGASASWPCSSARLLYSSSELEGDSDAQ